MSPPTVDPIAETSDPADAGKAVPFSDWKPTEPPPVIEWNPVWPAEDPLDRWPGRRVPRAGEMVEYRPWKADRSRMAERKVTSEGVEMGMIPTGYGAQLVIGAPHAPTTVERWVKDPISAPVLAFVVAVHDVGRADLALVDGGKRLDWVAGSTEPRAGCWSYPPGG